MRFGEGNMAGTDHNFIAKGTANTGIVFTGVDLSHFTPSYFSKRFRWQLVDLEGSVRVARLENMAHEQGGCRIMNATVDGKLNVFPKVVYSGLFKFQKKGQYERKPENFITAAGRRDWNSFVNGVRTGCLLADNDSIPR